jgi:16S rRNA (cytosine1402-N4)-methyltransferase
VPSHTPVLLSEVLATLSPQPNQTLLDCTAGLGGHSAALAPLLKSGTIILNDSDPANLALAAAAVKSANPAAQIITLHGNFADAPRRLLESNLKADLILADLGFSSNQVDTPLRGFSFQSDGPLDMRLDPTSPVTAADLIASTSEADLARLIRDYGDEPAAPRIARKLVESRRQAPISTTGQLADIVRSVVGRRPGAIDPATRTFQAVRIAVNDELGSLSALLAAIERGGGWGEGAKTAGDGRAWMNAGTRVAIISFHSLEDRLVKRSFATLVASGNAEHIARRPIEASDSEIASNPRARSAKLRAIRLIG